MSQPAQIPVFHVKNMNDALEFYGEVLGFEKDWAWQHAENLPVFASVSRGAHTLFLSEHKECAAGGLAYFYLETPDAVHALAELMEKNGGRIDYGPVDQPWQMRELQILDPFGNKLRFGAKMGDE